MQRCVALFHFTFLNHQQLQHKNNCRLTCWFNHQWVRSWSHQHWQHLWFKTAFQVKCWGAVRSITLLLIIQKWFWFMWKKAINQYTSNFFKNNSITVQKGFEFRQIQVSEACPSEVIDYFSVELWVCVTRKFYPYQPNYFFPINSWNKNQMYMENHLKIAFPTKKGQWPLWK